MAKLQDKLMNRVIEGELTLDSAEQEGIVNPDNVKKAINGQDITPKKITASGDISTTEDLEVGGDAEISGDVSVKTIEQSQANNTITMEINPDAGVSFTLSPIYNRFIKVNSELDVIVNLAIKNDTSGAVSLTKVGVAITALPENIAEKIVDCLGHTVKESGVAQSIIASCQATVFSNSYITFAIASSAVFGKIILTNHATANACQVYIVLDSSLTIPANSTYILTGRMSLSLL